MSVKIQADGVEGHIIELEPSSFFLPVNFLDAILTILLMHIPLLITRGYTMTPGIQDTYLKVLEMSISKADKSFDDVMLVIGMLFLFVLENLLYIF